MPRFKVIVTDTITEPLGPERQVLGEVAEVLALDGNCEDDLRGEVEDADGLLVYHNLSVSARTIDRLERCRVIVRCGVGYDNVDGLFARQRSIALLNVPDYGTEDVANTAVGMMLALTRGITALNSRLQAGLGPWSYAQVAPLHRLRGRVFAVVGLGRIGTAAAVRAGALGMQVTFYDPYKDDGYDKALGVRRAETLDELLEQAEVLSLHCPLTDETRHMIDATALAKMPSGSYLINTARGAVVDTGEVVRAIERGQLAGAAIDVLDTEPPRGTEPLIAAWRNPAHAAHHRVIINPHAAFYSEQGLLEMRTSAAEACRRALLGLPLRNVVN